MITRGKRFPNKIITPNIEENEYMPVTLHELAKAAGVSVSTVSRALTNSDHPVNEETRQKILRLAEELGYRPNLVARSLRTYKTHTVGIIADNICSPFTPLIIRGIQDHLKQDGYFSLIINTDWNPQLEKQAIHDLISRSIDGIIFVESWLREANPTLDLENKPYIFVHRLFGASYRHAVGPDERYGACIAVEHLLKLGHHQIGYINGPDGWYASTERLIGYKEALITHGIVFKPDLVERGDWEVQSGYPAAQRLLKLSQRPDAIFASNDLMALGAIYAIQEAGLRVPDDIAVVGYDDREIASIARPTITTVTLPCYEMGQASAQLLLRLLNNHVENVETIKIQGKLIVRESCGAEEGKITLEKMRSHTTPRHLLMNNMINE
jgi:DNA-binding LacI/PurR family transcriptional regulator